MAFAATPLAFLAGLARADFSQARGVRSLVARLADLPGRSDLRDALAGMFGDPTLSLAFWVPEHDGYVDDTGAAVELPATGDPARAVTEIERDGRRIAAIVHDRALLEDSETVRAAGAATALLLENQRLDAELRAHMVELRASRARLVEAGDAERRRLERDLHDGAQSRLVALALQLRLARGHLEDDSQAAALVDDSIDELKQSLAELRELARGIHPAVLSERGLEPALRSLAARANVPVELVGAPGGAPAGRGRDRGVLRRRRGPDQCRQVRAGGARHGAHAAHGRPAAARGLRRRDRRRRARRPARACTGSRTASPRSTATLEIASPPGGGTRLRVRLPCA